jgi:hypothetical protein
MAVSGPAALAWHGIQAYAGDSVDVLVKLECRKRSVGFARLQRTAVMPNVACGDGELVYARRVLSPIRSGSCARSVTSGPLWQPACS